MLKKYYTADMIDDKGVMIGSSFFAAWFFVTPNTVWKRMTSERPKGTNLIAFRRVK